MPWIPGKHVLGRTTTPPMNEGTASGPRWTAKEQVAQTHESNRRGSTRSSDLEELDRSAGDHQASGDGGTTAP
jgi:hypothetical protein